MHLVKVQIITTLLSVAVCFMGTVAQAQTLAVPMQTLVSACPYVWGTTMRLGSSGEGVFHLQQFLNTSPDTMVAKIGSGSPGHENKTFGALTKAAVIKFQEKYAEDILTPAGLLKGTGAVGAATRTKLNQLCSAPLVVSMSPMTIVSSTSTARLIITPAQQPAHMLAPANALYVPTTAATLTAQGGDVTVTRIVAKRVGPSSDGALSYVSLLDEDGNELSSASLHADHTVTFTDSFTIPANTSMDITVSANMASDLTDYDGQQLGFEIGSIDASAPVAGVLPITGTFQTTNQSLTIGSAFAELSQFDPNTATNRYINDAGIRFSGIKITAGSQENLTLHSISWRSSGSAAISDLSNLFVVVGGQTYSTTEDDTYITANFGAEGIKIAKGNSVEAYIQGTVGVAAANRTVEFDIDYPTDVSITGDTYGYGIYLLPGGNTATSGSSVFLTDDGETSGISLMPFFKGSSATISAGTATNIGKN